MDLAEFIHETFFYELFKLSPSRRIFYLNLSATIHKIGRRRTIQSMSLYNFAFRTLSVNVACFHMHFVLKN